MNLPYLISIKARGRLYVYYRRGGRRWPIKHPVTGLALKPGDAGFLGAYEALHKSFDKPPEGPQGQPVVRGSWRDMIVFYKGTPQYKRLGEQSRTAYIRYLEELAQPRDRKTGRGQNWENLPLNRLTHEALLDLQEQGQDEPARTNYMLRVVRAVLGLALKRKSRFGMSHNPAEGIEPLAKGEGYLPWPEAVRLEVMAQATPAERLAILAAYYSDQRAGDLAKMRVSDYDGEGIVVTQQKTGKVLWVPCHPLLKRELDAELRRRRDGSVAAVTLLTDDDGRSLSRWKLSRLVAGAAARAGHGQYKLHGLRKANQVALAEAEATDAEMQGFSGHATYQMTRLYRKGADQKKLAKAALVKLVRAENKAKRAKGKKNKNRS